MILNNKYIVEATNNNERATKDSDNSSNVISLKKIISFQGVPKYEPVNIDTLGLRRSPRLVNNNKKLDMALNHAGFMHVIDSSDEDNVETKKTCTLKRR